jgi:exosortase A-associated hydrolase 1
VQAAARAHHRSVAAVNAHATERAVLFDCEGERLPAIVSVPAAPRPRGVLIIVGGPQYRVGSHRQFTLLARGLAAAGIPCMRFDVRGMGDGSGDARTFEHVEADLGAAIVTFLSQMPGLEQVVLWGLCDAASAALMFGAAHPRVAGMVLLNPWVRSAATLSQARIRHYYKDRLVSAELWRKILHGQIDWRGSLASLAQTVRSARRSQAPAPERTSAGAATEAPFQVRMALGLRRFAGPTLLILSGNDLTAKEFIEHAARDPHWREALARPGLTRVDLPQADHTFSQRVWHAQMERTTLAWLESW